jgi:hypothetical protein
MCLQSYIYQQAIDGICIHPDFAVTLLLADLGFGEFQTVERALAGQRLALIPFHCAVVTLRVPLASQHRQNGICAQLIMIV